MAFDFWVTLTVCRLAKGCVKIDQSEQGLKAGVQQGEDQKRRNFSESHCGGTQWLLAHITFVSVCFLCCSLLRLLSSAQTVEELS